MPVGARCSMQKSSRKGCARSLFYTLPVSLIEDVKLLLIDDQKPVHDKPLRVRLISSTARDIIDQLS